MLNIERLDGPEALEALEPEWEMISSMISPRTPFSGPLWNILWWKYLREDSFSVRDEFYVLAIRDESHNLVAVAPLMRTLRPSIGPVRICELQFFGADSFFTEIRGLVCLPENQLKVVEALVHYLNQRKKEWNWVQWHGLHYDSPAATWLRHTGLQPWRETEPNYYLILPESWEEFKSKLSRNIKESLRKCYNSLKRDGYEFSFRVVAEPAEIPEALDLFFTLHSARAVAPVAVRHRNVFAPPRRREFLKEYAEKMAGRHCLRIFQLVIGDTVVATRIGFVLGDELYLYYSGYDPQWGKYSVMTTVVSESIKWAIEQGFKIVNLSIGTDVSKTRWKPSEIHFCDGAQVAPNLQSRVVFSLIRRICPIFWNNSLARNLLTGIVRRKGT